MRFLARLLVIVIALSAPGTAGALDQTDFGRLPTSALKRLTLPPTDQDSRGEIGGFSVTPPADTPPGWTARNTITDYIRDFALANLPDYSAVVLGGLAVDTGADQSTNLMRAVSKIPPSGGRLRLPCGKIGLAGTVTVTGDRIFVEGANQYCTQIVSLPAFTDGDVLKITGLYSGVRNVAFSHIDTEGGIARNSGYTVNLANGYGVVENVSMRHCFVCIRLGTAGGWSKVDRAMLQYMADGAAHPGSGGILVDNGTVGPANWISNTIIMSNFIAPTGVRYPSYAVKIVSSGETHLVANDFISNRFNLIIAPGDGQTVQATKLIGNYFDSGRDGNILVRPTGSGYVFDIAADNNWLTNIENASSIGIMLDGTQATPATDKGVTKSILGFEWRGGLIVSTTAQGNGVPSGGGLVCTNDNVQDVNISGTIIAGWGVGVDLGPGCSHATIADNRIGAYSPFPVRAEARTNLVGIRIQGGAGDWIDIHNNRLFGNTTAALGDGASGTHISIKDNLGYNPIGSANVPATGTGMTLAAGHVPTVFFVSGGTGVSVMLPASDGGGLVVACTGTPCAVPLAPNQTATLTYSGVPVITKTLQ